MALLTTQNLILAAVFAHLALALSRSIWKRPAQQAQINAIESKVDSTVSTVQEILPVVQTLNRKTLTTTTGLLGVGEELSQALQPLPSDAQAATSQKVSS